MSGEKIGMVLQKHTIDEVLPTDINLMIDWAYNEFIPPNCIHSLKKND